MKAFEWIDRLKAEKGWESDYRVAQEVQVARATISKYRSKPESTMAADVAVRVADGLGERPELVLIDQLAERSKTEAERQALHGVLDDIRGKVSAAARIGAGGKGRIDISCVTLAGGDPSELHRNTHRINRITMPALLPAHEEHRRKSEEAFLAMLANRMAAQGTSTTGARH